MGSLLGWLITATLLAQIVGGQAGWGQESPSPLSFNRDIRPILGDHCFACHGPDAAHRESDLRLDDRQTAIDFGAIIPGDPDNSLMIERIESDDAGWIMPPAHLQKPLSESQRQTLRRWVEQGAPYETHWAYVRPQRPDVPKLNPELNDPDRVHNEIDRFVQAKLSEVGLQPAPTADRLQLLRRAYLDLTGLLPPVELIDQLLDPETDFDYQQAIDRLIDSPQFGERMAAAWLDVARYADTVGYHGDQNHNAFPYRDWVIQAFNQNLPFDEFTRMQLAGDLYPEPTEQHLIASCFNRLNMMTREGGAQPDEYLAKYAADRVRTVGGAWLGSTIGCAECHDHKYDPFSARDFYQFAAFFADLKQWGVYHDYHYTPNPDLRGFSNDHPFPPEREVEVPYLQQRSIRLQRERDQLAIEALEKFAAETGNRVKFEQWRETMIQFLKSHPSGWQSLTLEPIERDSEEKNADKGEFLVSLPSTLTSLRLEVHPNSSFENRLFPPRQPSRDLRLQVEILSADGDQRRSVPIYFAESASKLHRYYNGFEIPGVHQVWRIPNGNQAVESVWMLAEPMTLQAGERWVFRITGHDDVTVSGSMLVPVDLTQSQQWIDELSRFQQPLESWLADPFFARQWVVSGGAAKEDRQRLRQLESEIRACRGGVWPVMISESIEPRVTRVLPRGDWLDQSGEIVEPQFPAFLVQSDDSQARLNRMDLANWLVADDNPLTARVQVNRLWKHFFGEGLSPVLDDFGIQGQFPTHPELLDWLAVEFVESGWNVKHIVRLIVTSHTYRQSSQPSKQAIANDPTNHLLSYQNARRLEAEIVRDSQLSAAGILNLDMGGPPVFPYQPDNYYQHLQFPDRKYVASTDDRQYRRGIYTHWQRTFLHPMMANFDAPPREECTGMRSEANTPQQALTLLNDRTFVEAAVQLAAELHRQDFSDDEVRIDWLYRRTLSRQPQTNELNSLLEFVNQQRENWSNRTDQAQRLLKFGNLSPPAEVESIELAVWATVSRVVLNLHEMITRY